MHSVAKKYWNQHKNKKSLRLLLLDTRNHFINPSGLSIPPKSPPETTTEKHGWRFQCTFFSLMFSPNKHCSIWLLEVVKVKSNKTLDATELTEISLLTDQVSLFPRYQNNRTNLLTRIFKSQYFVFSATKQMKKKRRSKQNLTYKTHRDRFECWRRDHEDKTAPYRIHKPLYHPKKSPCTPSSLLPSGFSLKNTKPRYRSKQIHNFYTKSKFNIKQNKTRTKFIRIPNLQGKKEGS